MILVISDLAHRQSLAPKCVNDNGILRNKPTLYDLSSWYIKTSLKKRENCLMLIKLSTTNGPRLVMSKKSKPI